MSNGIYPSPVSCSYCHRNVVDTDATWYEGLPYHDHCMKFYFATELKHYSKKAALGNITLAEAKLMREIQENYDLTKNSPASIPISKLINPEKPRFAGNTELALMTVRRLSLNSSKDCPQISEPEQTMISTGKT